MGKWLNEEDKERWMKEWRNVYSPGMVMKVGYANKTLWNEHSDII